MPQPPFSVGPRVLELTAAIERLIGRFEGLNAPRPQPRLRKENRVRTVQGSVAIEGNRLSIEQVTALLDGKRVAGSGREILEIQNANRAYGQAARFRPGSVKDLLAAHKLLMSGLVPDAGRWRAGEVGVLRGSRVAHLAPPARQVPRLMAGLLEWVRKGATPALIKACVVHYEIQFIHPFSDGNGRVGRLWQHVLLIRESPVFEFVPFESLVRERQRAYYAALGRSDRAGNCDAFLEFSLATLREALSGLLDELRPERQSASGRLELARAAFPRGWFSRRDYLKLHKTLSTATASRDLREGVDGGLLRRRGERRLTTYALR
ncbi:MAG: Fic family protein [Myxococcaceae bacterium]